MKKKVLMSLVLLAIIGTSAVFAQQPTLDKLSFTVGKDDCTVKAKDSNISGAVVIPDTYEGKPVRSVGLFKNITGITSITFPASVDHFINDAFYGCTNLTSVTFGGSVVKSMYSFPGDLRTKFQAKTGGAGTYTRQAGSDTWTKQGGVAVCPTCGQPLPAGFKLP